MTAPLPHPNPPVDRGWRARRLAEARAVIADAAHHQDSLVALACGVLALHGETEAERRDARALQLVVDARRPRRHRHHQHRDDDPDTSDTHEVRT